MAKKVAVRYTNHSGKIKYQTVNWFRHDGFNQAGTNVDSLTEDNYAFATIKCRACGANDWTENGESINQYECSCCGAFVTVEPGNG